MNFCRFGCIVIPSLEVIKEFQTKLAAAILAAVIFAIIACAESIKTFFSVLTCLPESKGGIPLCSHKES